MLTDYTIDGFENIKYQDHRWLKKIKSDMMELFTTYGYVQVETPTFESYDFYVDEDSVNRNDLFKLINSSGKVLTLKPDATLPIARMAAINHHDPEEIIKFCYETNIYKDFSKSEIAKKETTQAGIEFFGIDDASSDAEVILLSVLALKGFGIENIHIDIGHVGFINALLDELDLDDYNRDRLFRYIENKNIGDIHLFIKENNIEERFKKAMLLLPRLYGKPEKVLEEMKPLILNEKMDEAYLRLKETYEFLKNLGFDKNIHFDIGFTNRMNYYTGIIFKGYLEDYGEALINGGRYDNLSKKFGIDRPACGFSIDLILFLDYLKSSGKISTKRPVYYVLFYKKGKEREAFKRLEEKRKEGFPRAEMILMKDDLNTEVNRLKKNVHYENTVIEVLGEED